MLYFIKRSIVWLRRMHYSKGFGVQSPWAYKFVREVINDHTSYSIYKSLEKRVFGLDKRTRKLCRFYYRLAKYVQPDAVLDYCPGGTLYKVYIASGHRNSYREVSEGTAFAESEQALSLDDKRVLVRVSCQADYKSFVNACLDKLSSQSVIVIQHIKRDASTAGFWKEMVADKRVGVSFDLYYCGVLFLNTKMYKQNYIVNF